MNRALLQNVDPDILNTMRALFPGAHISVGPRSEHDTSFRFVPGVRRTHMLVPANHPKAAAGAVDRPSASDSRRKTLKRRAVGAALRSPKLADTMMPTTLTVGSSEDSILDHLSDAVGHGVQFSMAIGSRRANRKPVLAVYAGDTEVGFAKVGLNPLANRLIEREAETLVALSQARITHFRSPRVIHHAQWRSNSVLLMESLRPQRRSLSGEIPHAAIVEIVRTGTPTTEPVAGTEWFKHLLIAANTLREQGRPELSRLTDNYRGAFGTVRAPFGRWHGDLGPWNMVWDKSSASIWDWERSEASVPAGLDAVHFTCHSSLREIGNLSRARAALETSGTAALREAITGVGANGSNDRLLRACLLGYLLSVGARFSEDAERHGGEMVRPLADWYLAVLDDQLSNEEW